MTAKEFKNYLIALFDDDNHNVMHDPESCGNFIEFDEYEHIDPKLGGFDEVLIVTGENGTFSLCISKIKT